MPAKKDVRLKSTVTVLIIGLMVNNLFPAKMGELARAYLIGEKERLPKTLCFSTIMVEHLLDVLVLLIFLVLLMPMVSLPSWLRDKRDSNWLRSPGADPGSVFRRPAGR